MCFGSNRMINYIINEDGVVVGSEQASRKAPQPLKLGQTRVSSDQPLVNPGDWQWNGEEFEMRPAVPYTVSETTILAMAESAMTFPNHTIIDILGPGISERLVDEELTFSSSLSGVYKFTLTARGYRVTRFEVLVV